MKGHSDVLVGIQYGDEGKARVIDLLLEMFADHYGALVRFNGGPNAGHTLEVGDKRLALHQIPSGVFHPNLLMYVGSGCVLNLEKLLLEIKEVEQLGLALDDRFFISDQSTVIQPHHILLDSIMGKAIGTTSNGIGPAYADRALRSDGKFLRNLRVGDVLDDPTLARETIIGNFRQTLALYNLPEEIRRKIDIKQKAEEIVAATATLQKEICKNPLFLDDFVRKGKNVLFEGAQASMLDVVKGTVPYVTSSHTLAGSAYVGGDLSPQYHRKTFGVAKAVMSRVGNGPFVSEFGREQSEEYCAAEEYCPKQDKNVPRYRKEVESELYSVDELLKSADLFTIGIGLRMLGNEYGATTKRPRRIGMLDLVSLAHHARLNGVDDLYINKFDCLSDYGRTSLEGTPVVEAYHLNGEEIQYVPGTTKGSRDAQSVVKYYPHLKQDISGVRNYSDLPLEARDLIKVIEERTGCKVAGVGVGPEREQFVRI